MNRVLKLEERYLHLIKAQEGKVSRRDESLEWEAIHMASSGRVAWMLAEKRNVDPELASCAAAIHDIGRVLSGKQKDHAVAGYYPAKVFLSESGLFSDEEIELIALAVKNHSSKTVVGTPIEEIVKDADVIDCYQYGAPFDREEKKTRYEAWLAENE